jgi:hypothetical protein
MGLPHRTVVVQILDHQCIAIIKPSTKQATKQYRERRESKG